ncbi:MAG: hypothetical protein AB8B69_25055 [Chitinophagales bacterium]
MYFFKTVLTLNLVFVKNRDKLFKEEAFLGNVSAIEIAVTEFVLNIP